MAGKKDTFGLTAKQLRFAQGAVSGMSLADAYRQAYDAENMTAKAIQVEASRLASRADIALAMESISAKKAKEMQVLTVSDRDNLLTKLRSWTNGEAVATASQLRAAELLGKACGLYRDVIEHTGTRSASDILADIESRLNAIAPTTPDDSDSAPTAH
jgi:hypothetical protein